MATVNRPPFWVPRPYDGPTWWPTLETQDAETVHLVSAIMQIPRAKQWVPYYTYQEPATWWPTLENMDAEAAALTPLIVQLPRTKRWLPHYTYQEPATWWPTLENMDAEAAALTPLIVQLPRTKRWMLHYTYDETPTWWPTLETLDAETLQDLIRVQFYGAPGQVPTRDWAPYYGRDNDPGTWWPVAEQQDMPDVLQQPAGAPFTNEPVWSFRYDETPTWWPALETQNAEAVVLTPLIAQLPFKLKVHWPYTYDETLAWRGAPLASDLVTVLAPTQAPLTSFRWGAPLNDVAAWQWQVGAQTLTLFLPQGAPFTGRPPAWYTETTLWTGMPEAAAVLPLLTQQRVYGAGGQVLPFRWNATLDDAASWQWPLYERNVSVLQPAGQPFANRQTYWYAENSDWLGAPAALNRGVLKPTAPPQRPPVYYAEEAYWQGAPVKSPVIADLTAQIIYGRGGQVPPFRWNATLDDAASWQWPLYVRNANTYGLLAQSAPFENRQIYWYAEYSDWVGIPATRNRQILQPTTPSQRPPVYYAEYSDWQGAPVGRNRNTLQLVSTPQQHAPPTWYAEYSDWQGAPVGRNPLTLQIGPSAHAPPTWYAEDAYWQGAPTRAEIISLLAQPRVYGQGGQAPPFRWNLTRDDPPSHRQTTPSAAVISLLTAAQFYGRGGEVLPRWWRFYYDDASVWQRALELNFSVVSSVVVPPPPASANVILAAVSVDYAASSLSVVEAVESTSSVEYAVTSATEV